MITQINTNITISVHIKGQTKMEWFVNKPAYIMEISLGKNLR